MNCCAAELSGETKEQAKTNKEISKALKEERKVREEEIRLLLLGAGESGKSTIAKQMKIIHMGGYSEEEKSSFVTAIHINIWESMSAIVKATEELEIPIKDDNSRQLAEQFNIAFPGRITQENVAAIVTLWADPSIQKTYAQRNRYQLNDSCQYFMDDIKRVTAADFIPNEQDVLRSRIQTTGIIETTFLVEGKKFTIVDVGGQRSERKKWMHCFEDVTGVLFCVGISAFDQTLYEDNKTNRMHEALKLFHEICQSKWFSNTAMILFLNKEDLFREKLKAGKSIKVAFDDYPGPTEFEPSVKFIEDKFIDIVDPATGKPKEIYTHVTCATDTKGVKVVFDAARDFILTKALGASGLM